MENPVGYGAPYLRLGPRRLTLTETCGQKMPHGAIHPQRLLQTLLWTHGAEDRHLTRKGDALMVNFCKVSHEAK